MEYDNTNSGAFFKNDQKATANHPDYKGSVNVNGVDYWISGWIKPTKADPSKRFMSLSVQPKQTAQQAPTTRTEPPAYRKPSQDAARARQTAPQPRFEDDSDLPPF
jgi:hypothetical protein